MQITVEISLYPLREDYGHEVLSFLNDLRSQNDLEIRTNNMSTQITGDFDFIMPALMKAMKSALEKDHKSSMVLKVLNEGMDLEWLEF